MKSRHIEAATSWAKAATIVAAVVLLSGTVGLVIAGLTMAATGAP